MLKEEHRDLDFHFVHLDHGALICIILDSFRSEVAGLILASDSVINIIDNL